MAQTDLCRLCVNPCSGHISLYDPQGVGNWIYKMTVKYFHTVISNAADKHGIQLSNICLKCLSAIGDYYVFEQSVFEAQATLLQDSNAPVLDNVCQLCICPYGDQYKNLCNIPANEVYQRTFKYVHSMFSKPDGHRIVCLKCWDHLQKFHKFHAEIYESQKMLANGKDIAHEVIVKIKEERIPPMGSQLCVSQTNEEHVSVNAEFYATHPEFPSVLNKVEVDPEPIDLLDYKTMQQSKLSANEMSCNKTLDQSKHIGLIDSVPNKIDTNEANFDLPLMSNDAQIKSEYIDLLECKATPQSKHHSNQMPCNSMLEKSKLLGRDEQFRVKSNSSTDQSSTEENPKEISYYQDSIILPKLEIMDVPPEYNSNQGSCTKIKKAKTAAKDLDDIIAQWMPNLECVVCSGQFISFTLLQQHFRGQHPASEFHIMCCQRKIVQRHSIAEHAKIHLDSEAYTCKLCGKRLNSRSSLNSHRIKQHSKKKHEKNESERSNEFVEINKMKRAPIKSYREMDDYIAQWRTSLNCELCGEAFVRYTVLEQHFRREHPQERCFIYCCRSKLKYRSQIAKHIVKHIDPNANKCDICQKCFCSNSSLKYHKKVVHPINVDPEANKCDICYKNYSSEANLKCHKKTVHFTAKVKKNISKRSKENPLNSR